MSINALRQYLDFYGKEINPNWMAERAGPGKSGELRPGLLWAEKMLQMNGGAGVEQPRPDAYDLQQQANSQANSMSTMRNAQRFADVADMEAMQRFMPKQQVQEQYDDEGLPVGRNYGRNLRNQQRNSLPSPEENYLSALTRRVSMPMPQQPNFFGDELPQAQRMERPQTQLRGPDPQLMNYLSRLMGGR